MIKHFENAGELGHIQGVFYDTMDEEWKSFLLSGIATIQEDVNTSESWPISGPHAMPPLLLPMDKEVFPLGAS